MDYTNSGSQPVDWDLAELSVLLGAGANNFGLTDDSGPWAVFENDYSICRSQGHYWLGSPGGDIIHVSQARSRMELTRLAKLARKAVSNS